MPYLTPDEIPEDDICRPLTIPSSTAWLAIVSGALRELTQPYNWEQLGAVTVDEAVERMQQMVDEYYADPCNNCVLPDGEEIVTLDENGEWLMLDSNGAWVAPFGDYALPAQTARSGGTDDELMCLAARNAVNVLAQLYEETSDAAESNIQWAEWLVDLGLLIATVIYAPVGLLARAAMAIAVFAFREFFEFSDFITEDFWTAEFTEKLECIFLDHATIDAGVVSFDFNAIYDEIFNTQEFDLVLQGFRLAGQVMYLLRILGAEGINLAGETTAITDPDCDACAGLRCIIYDFRTGTHGATINGGTQTSGQGIVGANFGGGNLSNATITLAFPDRYVTQINVTYTKNGGSGTNNANNKLVRLDGSTVQSNGTNTLGTEVTLSVLPEQMVDGFIWDLNSGTDATPVTMHQVVVYYTGDEITGQGEPC